VGVTADRKAGVSALIKAIMATVATITTATITPGLFQTGGGKAFFLFIFARVLAFLALDFRGIGFSSVHHSIDRVAHQLLF
jgi:hypothetical protein